MDLDLILRTSALLLLAMGLSRALYNAAPATRHLIWHLAIVFVVLAPVLTPLAPTIELPALEVLGMRTVPNGAGFVPSALSAGESPSLPTRTMGAVGTDPIGTLSTIGTLGTLTVGAWFVICWVLSGVSVWRGSRTAPAGWISEARHVAARLGFSGLVDVRETRIDGSPHVAGLFRSIVMMPPSAREWTSEERQAAFVHELTHIRRSDRRTQALAQFACAIYWFNPLVWHAAAALARERERACDDEVLRVGVKPSAYAALLLDLARRPAAWTPATALSMARPSAIEGRLIMILADVTRTPRRSSRWLIGAAIAVFTTAALGAQRPAAVPAEQPSPAARPAPLLKPQAVMQLDEVGRVEGITDILVRSLGDASSDVREQAAMGLALTPGNGVIDPLLAALKDRDSQVREKAAIGLAFRRDPRIIEPLLAAMNDADGQVREKAAIALGASGDARAADSLRKATSDPDPQGREKAVAGLVLLGLRR
jgi:beta-lactamase regulating signal transducer with metallopeptidase domain